MSIYQCQQCKKEFRSYNRNPKFCSIVCKGDNQAPEININQLSKLYSEGDTQSEIAKKLGVSQKSVHKAMKRHGLKTRVAAKRDQFGENNHMWKGDNATKQAFHRRLYSRFGKPTECSQCGTNEADNYDYANLTGKYEDLDDYAPMCRSCHWKYDDKIKNIKHMKEKIDGGR